MSARQTLINHAASSTKIARKNGEHISNGLLKKNLMIAAKETGNGPYWRSLTDDQKYRMMNAVVRQSQVAGR